MLLMLFCSILALMSTRWLSIMFLVLFCFISVEISEIKLVCDRRTDRRMDRRMDGRTDIPSYRGRTHLKTYDSFLVLKRSSLLLKLLPLEFVLLIVFFFSSGITGKYLIRLSILKYFFISYVLFLV